MKGKEAAQFIIQICTYILTLCSHFIPVGTYTLTPYQSIVDGQTLISRGGKFELGFFSPSSVSRNRYLGIWYKKIPVRTVVWVANRDSPISDESGVFKIASTGELVIVVNQTSKVIWSSYSSKAVENPILEFRESGNLVLRDIKDGDLSTSLWQSFDYPGDTLLPGMKLGWNLKTGINRQLSSWRKSDDPSHGNYTYGMDLSGFPEFVMRNGSTRYYRGGSWNGVQGTGSPELRPSTKFTYNFFMDAEEIYFTYRLVNHLITWRLVLTQTSTGCELQRLTWADSTYTWTLEMSEPRDRCDVYRLCGSYSTCDLNDVEVCRCLKGFKPKSPRDWSQSDWSQGCERKISVNCSQGEGFRKYTGLKLPETASSWFNTSMNLDECREKCLNNCSCMGYANTDIRKGGSGCVLWFTDMIDMRHYRGAGQDLYVRMAASTLVEASSESNSNKKKHVKEIVTILFVGVVIALGFGGYWAWKKGRVQGGRERDDLELPLFSKSDDLELYDLDTIKSATNNFSNENKLGEGGFGSVYKGVLEGGDEIAVKRLSKYSIQGIDEFKNEIKLISKLQHNNLVRIHGCCVQGVERILVYEHMQNKGLDSFIFDPTKSRLLDWETRFQIILGVARGLLYLHHDSRLKIIHRDLKTSNILLDHEMVPKISDFGLARIFSGDQIEARTKRVIGTRGYMAPEYVLDGRFSDKSDVFSFGVILLEIICGKRNKCFSQPGHQFNLLGHAWRLWNERNSMKLVDEWMSNSCAVKDVLRCIHVGLLCVQKTIEQRPKMSCVVVMLGCETVVLPEPEPPGFYVERSRPVGEEPSSSYKDQCISNELTITMLEGR